MFEKLNFTNLLRYGLNGGVFLLALTLTRVGFDTTIFGSSGLVQSSALVLIAIVVGCLIYTIHIALVQDWVQKFLMMLVFCKYRGLKKCLEYPEVKDPKEDLPHPDSFLVRTYMRDYNRWIRRCNYPKFQQNMDQWSTQIHFLYGCFWAILTGAIIGGIMSNIIHFHIFLCLVVLSVLSLCGAVIQDCNALIYDCLFIIQKENIIKDLSETKPTDEET
jgi:hypothetical protein